jgi:NADP-dependent alcohol dehydrogenase
MLNFDFYNPTRIAFGKLLPAEARVLIVYGGSSARKSRTLDKSREVLEASI